MTIVFRGLQTRIHIDQRLVAFKYNKFQDGHTWKYISLVWKYYGVGKTKVILIL